MNTTKKLLVIILTLAITAAPAIAAQRQLNELSANKALIGSWCWSITGDDERVYYSKIDAKTFCLDFLEIHPSTYTFSWVNRGRDDDNDGPKKTICHITKVKTWFDRDVGVKVSRINANCKGFGAGNEGYSKEQKTAYADKKGILITEDQRFY